MGLSRMRITLAAGGGLLVLGAVISPAAAQAVTAGPAVHADVNGQCPVWTDGTTFGVGCSNLPGWDYYTQAKCQNGKYVTGPTETGTSGTKSYAYCSSVGSTVNTGFLVAYPASGGPIQQRAEGARVRQQARATLAAEAAQRHRDSVRPATTVNGGCGVWSDGNTFGSACDGLLGWFYQSQASCKNGNRVYGPTQLGTTYDWSYAYCSTVKSTVNFGNVVFTG